MKRAADALAADPAFHEVTRRFPGLFTIGGAVGASSTMAAAAIAKNSQYTTLVVVADPEEAERSALDLQHFGAQVRMLPPRGEQPDRLRLRLDAAAAAKANAKCIIVAPVIALFETIPNDAGIREGILQIRNGRALRPMELLKILIAKNFERVPLIARQGEVSLRGDLIDFWPHTTDAPIRIEVFDDLVESIRRFEPTTQRSIEKLDECVVSLVKDSGTDGVDPLDCFHKQSPVVLDDPDKINERAKGLTLQSDSNQDAYDRMERALGARTRIHISVMPGGDFDLGGRGVREMGVGLRPSHDILQTVAKQGDVFIYCHTAPEAKRLKDILKDRGVDTELPIHVEVGELSRGFSIPKLKITAVTHAELIGVIAIRRPVRARRTHDSRAVEHAGELKPGDYIVHAIHGVGLFRGTERLKKGTGEEEHIVLEYSGETTLYVPASRIDLIGKYIGAGRGAPALDRIGGVSFARRKAQVKKAVADLAAELLETQAKRETRTGFACPLDDELQREFEAAFPFIDTEDQVKCTIELKEDLESNRPMDRLLCGDVGYGKTELAMRTAFKTVRSGRQVAVLVPTTVLAEQHVRTFRERFSEFPVSVDCVSRFRSAKQMRDALRRAAEGSLDVLVGTHRILSKDIKFRDLGLVIIDEEQRFGVVAKERLKKLRTSVDVLSMTATPIPRTLHQALTGLRDISSLTTPPPGREAVETHVSTTDDDELLQKVLRHELNRGGQVYFVHNRIASLQYRTEQLAKLVPEARYASAHGRMGDDALEDTMTAFVRGEFDILVSTAIVESGMDIPEANTIVIDRAEWFGLADLHQLRGRVGRGSRKGYCYLLVPPNTPIGADAKARIRALEELQQLGAGFDIAMRDLEIRGTGNLLGSQQSGHIAAIGYELYCRLLKATVDRMTRERRTRLVRETELAKKLGIPKPAPLPRGNITFLSAEDDRALEGDRPVIAAEMLDPQDTVVPENNKVSGEDGGTQRVAPGDGRGIPMAKQDLESLDDSAAGVDLELGVRAFLPESYIPDVKMRLEAYRLLDSVRDPKSYDAVAADLRDRFGRTPPEAGRLMDLFYIKNTLAGSTIRLITYLRDRYLVDFTDRRRADAALGWFRDRRHVEEGRMHVVFDNEREKQPDEALRLLVKAVRHAAAAAAPQHISKK